jgi:hypothetical protein
MRSLNFQNAILNRTSGAAAVLQSRQKYTRIIVRTQITNHCHHPTMLSLLHSQSQ